MITKETIAEYVNEASKQGYRTALANRKVMDTLMGPDAPNPRKCKFLGLTFYEDPYLMSSTDIMFCHSGNYPIPENYTEEELYECHL